MRSPSLKPSSPADSASKSYKALQQGPDDRVGVVAGDGLGERSGGAPQADAPKAGLFLEEPCVGDCAGEAPGEVEIRLPELTGRLLLDDPGLWLGILADRQ